MIDILWPEITIAEKVLRDAIVRPRARMTAAMKAMVARAWGEPSSLVYADVTEPTPGPGEVLIDVRAVGCNFPDILIVQGKYQTKPPLPFSPGHEVAGVVRAVGPGVSELAVGQRVFALLKWGGYAERAVAPVARTHALPAGMTFEEGAAFGLVYQTSWCALTHRTRVRRGETLLVHGAAGGVGLSAVQIGKVLGARVLATAGSTEKLEVARAAGADALINYRTEDWVEIVKKETGGRGADVIYDPVGGDVFDGSTRCIAFEGRLLIIGLAGLRLGPAEAVTLAPGARALVPTGVAVAIPSGYAGLVLPRSGLALRHGVTVLNAPGLIDAGYRGEVKVLLVNHDREPASFARGERIAQLVIQPVARAHLDVVDHLPNSQRGEGGFGSTGA